MALFFLKRRKTPLSDPPWPPPEQGKERNILSFPSPGEEPGPGEGSKWPEVTEQDRPHLPAWPQAHLGAWLASLCGQQPLSFRCPF